MSDESHDYLAIPKQYNPLLKHFNLPQSEAKLNKIQDSIYTQFKTFVNYSPPPPPRTSTSSNDEPLITFTTIEQLINESTKPPYSMDPNLFLGYLIYEEMEHPWDIVLLRKKS